MAACKEERCAVCMKHLPKSSARRKLNTESTNHVVPVLREVAGRNFDAGLVSVLLPNDDNAFLCRQCFRNAEKLLQLRKDLYDMECKLVGLFKQTGIQRGLCPDVDVELATPPPVPHHSPTATEGIPEPSCPHPQTPIRVSALKKRALDTRLEEQIPSGCSISSPIQAPLPKRRALDTPSRRFMEQTHVTSSPAVAVSLQLKYNYVRW